MMLFGSLPPMDAFCYQPLTILHVLFPTITTPYRYLQFCVYICFFFYFLVLFKKYGSFFLPLPHLRSYKNLISPLYYFSFTGIYATVILCTSAFCTFNQFLEKYKRKKVNSIVVRWRIR